MVPLTEEKGSLGVGTPAFRAAPTLPSCPDQLQEELERKVQAWEQEFKGAFLVKGQQFMEYVSEQWQLYRLEKEKEKQERVSTELSMLASAWECPWLLPKNASLGLSLLGCACSFPAWKQQAVGLVPIAVTSTCAKPLSGPGCARGDTWLDPCASLRKFLLCGCARLSAGQCPLAVSHRCSSSVVLRCVSASVSHST